ncbi:hypothetical protein Tco_0491348 [Tanacetum coccineum]
MKELILTSNVYLMKRLKASRKSSMESLDDPSCPLGYYIRIDNYAPFGEKKPSLDELMNKHLEESTGRRAEMEDWMKKLQESTN